ncbi:MAG: isoprenylcysteine carboxylmethyltransferase family protein [Spirochaetota bacterium]
MPTSHSHYILLCIIACTILLRLIELVIAKKNAGKRKTALEVSEKYYFLFFILHPFFLISVPVEMIVFQRPFYPSIASISLFLLFFALIGRFSVLTSLRENWNTKVIYDPQDASSICTKGLYKYIRHPNYLIVIIELLAISLFHTCLFSLFFYSICNAGLLFFRIRAEEEKLLQNPHYASHFQHKKRFIPGIF